MSAHDTSIYAVALFPGEAGAVREVRVVAVNLFGGTPSDTIGAVVREVDTNGVPFAGKDRESIVPIQRLVFARMDDATGRRTVPGRELTEKKTAYAERLAAGPALNLLPPLRRKPRLSISVETDAASCSEPSPEELGWLAEHERDQEAAA